MDESPYLTNNRLADVLAAIQFLAAYSDYDLTEKELRKKIARAPVSANDWGSVLDQHPEFFRQSENANDYCLVLRRTKPKNAYSKRPPLEPEELQLLIETATFLQNHALENKIQRRGWFQMGLSIVAAIIAASAAIAAAIINSPAG